MGHLVERDTEKVEVLSTFFASVLFNDNVTSQNCRDQGESREQGGYTFGIKMIRSGKT